MVKWHIGTYARIRPPRRGHDCAKFMLNKVDDGNQCRAVITFPPPDDDGERLQMKQRDALQFQYSDIFDPGVSQEQVFNSVCLDIVHSALDGYNGTILAYGQTGSGKTYTITGGEHYSDRGIIPRVLSTIFEEFERRSHMRYSCYISYLEIYNENVYDLLDRSHTDRPIEEWTKVLLMDDDDGDMHFRNLGVYEAISEEEALNLLFLGNMNRVTSDTPMNQASSRSHSIFSVMIEARPIDSDLIVTSKLHLVDLAGSERVYKREGTQRMRSEGKHINLSLHHLEQVILSLRAKRNSVSKTYHIPYRNSMLTSVLRGSLGGNCKSVFIANLNPENDFVDESISTCRFMQRCSEVIVDVAVNSEIDAEKRVEALEKTNQQLESDNFELKARLVQLEHEMKGARQQFVREQEQTQQQHEQQLHRLEQQLAKVKAANNSPPTEIDWAKCEEIVENLLVAGELPRDLVFEKASLSGGDKHLENEIAMAQAMGQNVMQELRKLGMEYALACLHVMKENTFFASNAAAELQEMMTKQAQTLELLETRLMAQKQESEQMKQKIQQLTEAQATTTSVPRSKSHSGVTSKRRGVSRAESSQSNSAMNFSESDSDSDDDSEAAENHQYRHPQHRQHRAKTQQSTLGMVIANPPPAPSSASGKKSSESSRSSEDYSSKQSVLRQSTATDAAEQETATKAAGRSGSDLIRKRMEILKNGSLFVKYGRFGKPHVRFVWCSPDLEYLNYRQVSKPTAKASIPTRSIQRIHVGQVTKVFERAKQPAREPYCFSIEYDDNRTLDLEIADGENAEQKLAKRTEWVEVLQFLMKVKSAQKKPAAAAGPISNTTS